MRIKAEAFGTLPNGGRATLYTMENAAGMSVSLLDYGARVARLLAPDRRGTFADVVLGYDSAAPYADDDCLGAICGRYANRLRKGAFTLGGRVWQASINDGENTLHGGINGFHRKLWRGEILSDGLRFTYVSPDGEEGFPGTLRVDVIYRLSADNVLSVDYAAEADADTIVNLTNHSYFNLGGHGSGSVHAQTLAIYARFYTPVDPALLPTGEIASVEGTPFDFRSDKPIGRDIGTACEQLRYGGGYDHNFVLDKAERGALTPAARACDPLSGRVMEVWTTQPGLQLYTANALKRQQGKDGVLYDRRGAFCLETQLFPDAMTHAHFPSPVLRAGDVWRSRTEFRFLKPQA